MSKRSPIRRGAFGRGLAISLAGARAGGAFALDGALRKLRGDEAGNDERLAREAERFARSLGQLKGSYVKIGQIFAMLGEHFLPEPLTRALHQLESETQPLGWRDIEPVIEAALAGRQGELDIETSALAAASLAQVHRAHVRSSGRAVVVKSQYPELTNLLDEDFDAVVRMLRLARWIPVTRDFDSWLSTMREQLHMEVDYPREQEMAARFAEALARHPAAPAVPGVRLAVPRYYPDYCSTTVLTMDFVDGYRAGSAQVECLPQQVRNRLGRLMLELFFFEVFELGLMQLDPNFGNYLISANGDTLTLLDFGSVMALDDAMRSALADTIIAGHRGDDQMLIDALVRLGCLRNDSSDYARDTFRSFVRHLLEPLRHPNELPPHYLNSQGEYAWGRSSLISRAGKKAASSAASRHFSTPTGDFALIARKLTGVFTFIAVLAAEFNAWDIAEAAIERYQEGQ